MKTNKAKWIAAALVAAVALYAAFGMKKGDKTELTKKEMKVTVGDIEKTVTATGSVQPQNRLEMKPPVSGRVDQILVKEGQAVKAGEMVAKMSSTERAALLDAARAKGEKEMAYWEDIYKTIPLIAPIDGTVIVSTMQPGQTVTQADPVIVLSDRLIVRGQIDETDIGRVHEGQEARLSLDAYPDVRVEGKVSHIYHESQIVNNVTIYQVDIVPSEVPDVFRSGMSANIQITELRKESVLILPLEAVQGGKRGSFVMAVPGKGKKPERREIETGVKDDNNVEILSGLEEGDTVVIESKKYVASKGSKGGSPFGAQRPRQGNQGGGGGPR